MESRKPWPDRRFKSGTGTAVGQTVENGVLPRVKERPRAFSQIELLVTMAIFSLILGVVFALFHYGTRGFHKAQNRAFAHSQILAVKAALAADLQRGHFLGMHSDRIRVSVKDKKGGTVEARRDKLSAVTLSTWVTSAPGSLAQDEAFGYGGMPLWDAYVLYVAGQETEPATSLMRYVFFEGAGSPLASNAGAFTPPENLFATLTGNSDTDGSVAGMVKKSVLAESLSHFDVTLDPSSQVVTIRLRVLERQGDIVSEGEQNHQALSAIFSFRPYNTIPKL